MVMFSLDEHRSGADAAGVREPAAQIRPIRCKHVPQKAAIFR